LGSHGHYGGVMYWGNVGTGERTTSAGFTVVQRDDELIFILKYEAIRGDKKTDVECPVRLQKTPCHFGGVRWWFTCPHCERRAGTIHLCPRSTHFACRKCLGLVYHSQREHGLERAFSRKRRIESRLGRNSASGGPYRRPKGMHFRTYERLRNELSRANQACKMELDNAMNVFN
jgi:hypothetical protein